MHDPKEEASPLSEGGLAVLDAWIQSQVRSQDAEPPTLSLLVAYQSGMLAAEEVRAVESGLVKHPAARTLLRETRDALAVVRALPWHEVAERAKQEDTTGQVARVWLELVSAQLATAPPARRLWQSEGLSVVRRQWIEGVAEARTAWAAFLSFGQQLRASLQMPVAAQARDSEGMPTVVGALPPGITLSLAAEIGPDGTLTATLQARNAQGAPTPALAGMRVHLALWYNQQNWPLASTRLEGDQAEWTLPTLGHALDRKPGALPSHLFQITLGDMAPPSDTMPFSLLAEVLDAMGQPTEHRPVLLQLWSEPHWEAGEFRLRIALPAMVRRAYADYLLQLDVVLAAQSRQRLGLWPVREWNDEPRTLTAACPGSLDTTVPYATILHASLQPLSL